VGWLAVYQGRREVVCDSNCGIGPLGSSAEDLIDQWNMRLTLAMNLGLTS
jgi:hypothetical protein